jgi:xylulokinase
MGDLFLGLDSSTQSLSAMLIDHDQGQVVGELSVNFATDLPHWKTDNGVFRYEDPQVVNAPPLMWLEALDLLLGQAKNAGWPLSQVRAISGSGQQHGTVYLNNQVDSTLPMLDPDQTLHSQMHCCLARDTAPVWMDSSTSQQCREITNAVGGDQQVLSISGSVATERFSGPQIRKFAMQHEGDYAATTHICLVSSFLASVLAGEIVGIDYGDGSGMNLLDIQAKTWHADLCDATAFDLSYKLPPAVPSSQVVGTVSPYFIQRYGFAADCQVVAFSGDNPCSLIGLGLVRDGMTAISLGTSDTCFSYLATCPDAFSEEGHLFAAPCDGYMSLLCFKNGSLAREKIRAKFGIADWKQFGELVRSRPAGNEGALMLPWFDPEIVPKVLNPGVQTAHLAADDAAAQARAVYECQTLAMRLHLRQAGVNPRELRATGGASKDLVLLQIMADVFQAPVSVLQTSNSAGLGAALRAAQACRPDIPWQDIVAGFTNTIDGSSVKPNNANIDVYNDLLDAYADFEQATLTSRC